MRVYVGMDVHRKRSQVALVDEHGSQLLNRNLPNDSAELTSILGRLAPGTPVAFEAAYGWGWLVELLEELELEPHLVHPSRCKAIASARLKNDKVDAATLAQFLAWRNERLAASYAGRVEGATLAERTDALAEVLNEQGFMAEVEPADGGLRLCQHNCTVEHLATELPDLCASEAELFERLLGTRVERETTIVDGAVRCETRIDLGTRGKRPHNRTTPSPNRKAARSPA